MNNKIRFLSFFALALIGFSSCSKKVSSSKELFTTDVMGVNNSKVLRMASKSAAPQAYNDSVDFEMAEESAAVRSDNGSGTVNPQKKLVKTGNVNIEVQELAGSIDMVEKWAENLGGYVFNSSSSERNAWFTVKVPSAKFEDAMNTIGEIGKVLNHSVNTEDVTEQYYDLESRIQNKKVMKEKLEGYLKAAKDIKDLLQIERELNSVISEIDSMEGRLKRLSNQVEYSTISISLVLPSNHDEGGFIFPDLGNGFSDFVSAFLNFLAGFVRVFFLVILCGIPILASVAFLFWLLFGRVGLIFKLYNWLKKQK